jgi:hypothetical protein
MTREPANHLSEEALNDVLIGLGSREAEDHLAECASCSAKVQGFQAGVDAFNESSLAWSEARSRSMAGIDVRQRQRRIQYAAMGWAAAAILLLAVAIPVWRSGSYFGIRNNTVQIVPPEDSQGQIEEDNELLKAVNVAINENDVSLTNEKQLLEGPHPGVKARQE